MERESFIALHELYNATRHSTNPDKAKLLNSMFDTLNRHFGLITTSFAAIDAI
jgi:hypothetical protein